jgi:excisionase family DNA binding protein
VQTSPSELVYTAEAAQILGVKVRTVARMARDGRLTPAVASYGKTSALVFRRADVETLLSQLAS